ncbi:MAG: hypothetical protein PHN42_03015 [Bacilli bacterium]|nr:hypothetical protein [Bacilli bacterium]
MEKQYLNNKICQIYFFDKEEFSRYLDYSHSVTNNLIETLEEFCLINKLDVQNKNVQIAYIRFIKNKIKIKNIIIPNYLSFESYCSQLNINPYVHKTNNDKSPKVKIIC